MKCAWCTTELDPRHVWIMTLYTPEPHTVNIHPHCLIQVTDRSQARHLSQFALTNGWHQPMLPLGLGPSQSARTNEP